MKNIKEYITGLLDISSSVSSKIGRSHVIAIKYDKNKFGKEFAKNLELKEEVEVVECNLKLIDIFNEWLGEENLLSSSLNYYITKELKEPINIYELKDSKLLDRISSRKIGYFYFYEDLYFVEFEKEVICFILGNNE